VSLLGFAFVMGMLGTLSVGHLIHGKADRIAASITMVLISLAAGATLARREPIKSFLARKIVLGFLFLFNLVAALLCLVFVQSAQGRLAAVGLLWFQSVPAQASSGSAGRPAGTRQSQCDVK
jgi:hypothetical protein